MFIFKLKIELDVDELFMLHSDCSTEIELEKDALERVKSMEDVDPRIIRVKQARIDMYEKILDALSECEIQKVED
ncbi:hypothetical protein ACKRLN_01815 [Anaerococcus sp. DFU013_CI05]|uniref:hypothetical protein n=1 Tax=Anaerococcus sp. AH8042_DFU013_CI05 TaxID=3385202 RepID=UPI003A5228C7